jgi:hypothetical protein
MIECPVAGCSVEVNDEDLVAQAKHMKLLHPEVIARRLEADGFRQDPVTGQWVDGWS